MWISLGQVTPSIYAWGKTNVVAGVHYDKVTLTTLGNSSLIPIKSRILVRRNYEGYADKPIVVYPDMETPTFVEFPEISASEPIPVIEIKKIIWRGIRSYALAEDYKISVSVWSSN